MADTARLITAEDLRDASGGLVYNFSPSKISRYRNRLAGCLVGSNRLKIACYGDSLTTGQNAGTGTNGETNAKVKAYPATLALLMRKAGLVVSEDSFFGDYTVLQAGTAGITNYDPRLVFSGTGWSRSNRMMASQSLRSITVGDALAFTPTQNVANIQLFHARQTGNGQLSVADGATSLGTVECNGSQAFLASSVFPRTASMNAINIAHASGGDTYLVGVDSWAADTQVSVYNLGSSGAKSSDFGTGSTPWSPVNAQNTLDPDVIILNLGTNDIRAGVAAATFLTNIQAIINVAKTAGRDIILVNPVPDNAPGNPALVPDFQAARYSLADANDLPLIDMTARYGSYAAGSALGNYADPVHQTAKGYAEHAVAAFDLLRPQ